MLLIAAGTAIPKPANWPSGTSWNATQVALSDVFIDAFSFGHRRDVYSPGYQVTQLDETLLTNASRGDDLFNFWTQRDEYGLGKYYFLPGPPLALWERDLWVPAPFSYVPDPAQDVQVALPSSIERSDFEQALVNGLLATLHALATTTDTTIAQLNSDKQELARDVRILVRLLARFLFPDRADI